MNIMILSPGRRVDIVEYFRDALHQEGGRVITVDMSPLASGLYNGDVYYCINKDFGNIEPYVRKTIEIGRKEKADAVLTLIDPELPIIVKYKELYLQNGIIPIISDGDLAEKTIDKYMFYEAFRNEIPVVPTFQEKGAIIKAIRDGRISYPIFAKPQGGSGSEGLRTLSTEEELLFFSGEKYIFQPFSKKKEFGCDVYFDMCDGQIKRLFIKEKINMRSGETDKSISVHNENIVNLIMRLEGRGFKGPVDVDVFEDFDGNYVINEINPRIGGGYPHAYHCGQNFMECIIKNIRGERVDREIGNYKDGIIMMKYNGLFFIEQDKLALKEN